MLDFAVYAEIVRSLFLASFGQIADDAILYCWSHSMNVIEAADYIASI